MRHLYLLLLGFISLDAHSQIIKPDRKKIDFDTVYYLEPKSIEFKIINTGMQDAYVDISTSDDCFKVDFDPSPISPKGSLIVTLIIEDCIYLDKEEFITIVSPNENMPLKIPIKFVFAKRQGFHRTYWPDGTIKSEGSYQYGAKHGEWKEYYESGKLLSITNYELSNYRDTIINEDVYFSIKNGRYQCYFENGKLQSEIMYEKEKQKNSQSWYKNGQLSYKSEHAYPYVKSYSWHENGQLREERVNFKSANNNYVDETGEEMSINIKHRNYLSNGQLIYESLVDTTKMIEKETYYFEDGRKQKEFFYKKNPSSRIKTGINREWHENGQLKSREEYDSTKNEGLKKIVEIYYKNGDLNHKVLYDGLGALKESYMYYENGQLQAYSKRSDEINLWETKLYYPNGKLKEERIKTNKTIVQKNYDENGILIKEETKNINEK